MYIIYLTNDGQITKAESKKFQNCFFHLFYLVNFIALSGGQSKEDSTPLDSELSPNLQDVAKVNMCITLQF